MVGCYCFGSPNYDDDILIEKIKNYIEYYKVTHFYIPSEIIGTFSFNNLIGAFACIKLNGVKIKIHCRKIKDIKKVKKELEFIGDRVSYIYFPSSFLIDICSHMLLDADFSF